MSLTQQEAAAESVRRRRARDSLAGFSLAIDVPGKPSAPLETVDRVNEEGRLINRFDDGTISFAPIETQIADLHMLMMGAVENAIRTENGRLMMFFPPGSAKSTYASVVAPSWAMGRVDGFRTILASYATTIAAKQSRKARAICSVPSYSSLWASKARLTEDQRAIDEWALTNGSEFMAAGLLAGITGNRCFTGGTLISTPFGKKRIDSITCNDVVYGYDHINSRLVQARVRATRVLRSDRLVRIRTQGQRTFVCTADHRIFVPGDGYAEARLLKVGAPLLCYDMPVRPAEACRVESVPPVFQQSTRRAAVSAMYVVREGGDAPTVGVGETCEEQNSQSLLQQIVPDDACQCTAPQTKTASAGAQNPARHPLRLVPAALSAKVPPDKMLLQGSREQAPRATHGRQEQQQLQAREERSIPAPISGNAATDCGAGSGLCRVPHEKETALPSHRRLPTEQRERQPGDVVRGSPSDGAWLDRVSLVEDLCARDELVYDIQVEGTSNFFAEGILVHNCDLLIIDDPVANREQADSATIRSKIYDEYIDTALSRLLPGGTCILIMCMTGDTPVRMADGTERELRNIRPGDLVSTWRNGILSSAAVKHWADQGEDDVFELRSHSGATVRANARHPFLVERNGELQWVRVANLRLSDRFVRAGNPRIAKDNASPVTANGITLRSIRSAKTLLHTALGASKIDTVLRKPSTYFRSGHRTASVQFAESPRIVKTPARIGMGSCASTTVTKRIRFAAFCATIATWLSATVRPQKPSKPQPATCDFSLDTLIAITPAGRERVFDIQVEETENFIANGLVSHNTRWHEEDLAGSILPLDYNGESGLIECRDGQTWTVLCVPAEAERDDDPLGRKPGEFLWNEWFGGKKHWAPWRDNPRAARTWAALYQQRPAPDAGIHFDRGMFQMYNPNLPRGYVKGDL